VTAAHAVFGNKPAPIPQSTYGLAAFALLELKANIITGSIISFFIICYPLK
jgi:hypothetical protein